jgi:C4-dicarboxylate-specific signal transduction histidine kinase
MELGDAMRESERRYREVQVQLAHTNRVATIGQLSASIAHEVKRPLRPQSPMPMPR